MPSKVIRSAGAVFVALGFALGPLSSEAQANLVDLGKVSDFYSNGTLTPLGALPGSSDVTATGINAAGQVIGNVTSAPNLCPNYPAATAPVLFANGTLSPLTAALDCSLITPRATVNAINASGETAGSGAYGFAEETTFAWILTNGVRTLLEPSQFGPIIPGGVSSEAFGISDNGLVTGTVNNTISSPPVNDAFLFNNGAWTNLGPGSGLAVNSNGQVTGFLVVNGQNHAFLYGAAVTTGGPNRGPTEKVDAITRQ
jgi:uncharacterized membrane protein